MKNTKVYPIEHCYKDNLILEHKDGIFTYYLYDACGDINEYIAKSLKDAEDKIDKATLYDGNGNEITY